MVFHVIAGRRGFGDRTLGRLIQCEVTAGIRSRTSAAIEQGLQGIDLVAALFGTSGACLSEVTIQDIDAGRKEVSLEYRRGSPPPNYPVRLVVTAAKNETVWKSIDRQSAHEDIPDLLTECLPALENKTDLMDCLTPSCYVRVLNTAMDLTFGLNWRAKVRTKPNAPKRRSV